MNSKYECGNCGESKHYLWPQNDDILVVCCFCGNKSLLTITKPIFSIKWCDKNNGIIYIKEKQE